MSETAPHLDPAGLHHAVRDPALAAIGFLNEVMARHPEALSFAPGAPHPEFLPDLATDHYQRIFLDRLVRVQGRSPEEANRLLLEYGPIRGIIGDLVADALRRDHAIAATPESVVITVGAQEALLLVLRTLFASSDDVLAVADPCFVGITGAARLLDLAVVPVPETPTGVDLDALAHACEQTRRAGRRIRALYVAPDFSNPGGARMDLAGRHRLLDAAAREDLLLIEDNAYGFTAAPGEALPPLKALDTRGRVVHVGTFAKVCFPGARVGYVVADQRIATAAGPGATGGLLADAIATVKGMTTVNTSPVCQALIGGMLLEHGGSLAALSADRAARYQQNLGHLLDRLEHHLADRPPVGVSWNRPAGGFFVRVRLPVPADTDLLELCAAKYQVLWTPMAPFYVGGGGEHLLRLSCSYLEPEQIEEGVRRLADFLRKEVG